jgi:hypothetical protein
VTYNIFSEKIIYSDDEKIFYKKRITHPIYSARKSFRLFEKIIFSILKKKNNHRYIFIDKFNILSVALEDFFWQYCYQFIKYKNFFVKNKFNIKVSRSINSSNYKIDGYGRVKNYLYGNLNLINFFKFNIKNILFIFWLFYNFFVNRNKIWVDKSFLKDFRYQNFKINTNSILVIPFSLESFKFKSNNINEAFIADSKKKIKNYKIWMFAIKLLRPKKIILADNLYDNFSLLLAAKLLKVECIAVCHSVNIRFHMNIFGTKLISKKNAIIFDKIYVYHKIFRDFIIKYGSFYDKKNIKIIGWINNNNYNYKIKKNNSNSFVLYPFEHFCNFRKINNILSFFHKKNHQIIIKIRPDMENYDHFNKNLNISFVKDFSKEHIKNCICALGSTTSILFNLSQNFIPILYIFNNGYDHFDGLNLPPNWIKVSKINNSIYKKIKVLDVKSNFKLVAKNYHLSNL